MEFKCRCNECNSLNGVRVCVRVAWLCVSSAMRICKHARAYVCVWYARMSVLVAETVLILQNVRVRACVSARLLVHALACVCVWLYMCVFVVFARVGACGCRRACACQRARAHALRMVPAGVPVPLLL